MSVDLSWQVVEVLDPSNTSSEWAHLAIWSQWIQGGHIQHFSDGADLAITAIVDQLA